MKTYPLHPIVDLFEPLPADEAEQLAIDIDLYGILDPAWIWTDPDDRQTYLIEGRNRQNAVKRVNEMRKERWMRASTAKLIDDELDLQDAKDIELKDRLYGVHWGRKLQGVPKEVLEAITGEYPIHAIVRLYLAGPQPEMELPVRAYSGDSVVAFSLSNNLYRRHLSTTQRAWLVEHAAAMIEEEARQRMRSGTLAQRGARGKTAEHLARIAKVSARTMERVLTVRKNGTAELLDAARNGRISMTRAAEFAKLPAKEQLRRIQQQAKDAVATVNTYDIHDLFARWTNKIEKLHRQYESCEWPVPELVKWAEKGLALHASALTRLRRLGRTLR